MVPVKSTIATKTHEFFRGQATPHSVGYNIHAIADTSIPPNSYKAITTGLSMAILPGLYGHLAPRSGLAFKHHIDVGAGMIDPDFRGEIKVLLINSSQKKFTIKPDKTAKNAHVILDDDDNQPTPTTIKPTNGAHVISEEPPLITNTVPNCLSQPPPPIQAIDKPTSTEPE
eukprot:15272202-Ditylum_brightwellii.AAC.1